MQRTIAHLALVLVLLDWSAPVLFTADDANLPPCCRGNGIHHCAMARRAMGDDGSHGVRVNAPQCPYRARFILANRTVFAQPREVFLLHAPERGESCSAEHRILPKLVRIHHSERGPPLA